MVDIEKSFEYRFKNDFENGLNCCYKIKNCA